jgi:hypothetical protein
MAAWGMDWRERLEAAENKEAWMIQKRVFVLEVCKAWALPLPYNDYLPRQRIADGEGSSNSKYKSRDAANIELPRLAARDNLWRQDLCGTQLEFVVDNKTLSELANITANISNDFYRPAIERIRRNIRSAFQSRFEYKGGFLEPVDWRARDFNTAADLVADHVIANRSGIDTLVLEKLRKCIDEDGAIQVYTDGGFGQGVGSAAMVVISVTWEGAERRRTIIGVKGIFMENAISFFQTEVAALEMATDVVMTLMAPV